MARRSRTSRLEDITVLLSKLPWQVCVFIGLVTYLVLHGVATQPPPTTVDPRQMVGAIWGSAGRGLATAGQYIAPMLCLTAAFLSFVGRRKRRALLVTTMEGGASAAAIDALSWQEFELLIGEAFRMQGFSVLEKGGAGADGGIDLELMRDGERFLVQAKHWRARQVPVEVVRELAGVMLFRRAAGAYVITSGRFTKPAEKFAEGRGITLVNGVKLQGLLAQARVATEAKTQSRPPARHSPEAESLVRREPVQAPTPTPSAPSCPSCAGLMKLRTASKGPNAGKNVRGCATDTRRKGTRPV